MIDQRAGERDSLGHAAGKMMRKDIGKSFQPDQADEFVDLMTFFVKHAARDQTGLDVAPDGQPREKIRVLKDQAALGVGTGDRLRLPTQSSPESGESRPAMRRRSVDLPQPLGPTMETNSPAATDSETLSSASASGRARHSAWKIFVHVVRHARRSLLLQPCRRIGYHLIIPFCQTSTRSRTLNSTVMIVEKNAAMMTSAA